MTKAQKILLINARDHGHAMAFADGKTYPFSPSRDAAISRLVIAGFLSFDGWMAVLTEKGRRAITA